jgi:hypothetical protein
VHRVVALAAPRNRFTAYAVDSEAARPSVAVFLHRLAERYGYRAVVTAQRPACDRLTQLVILHWLSYGI